VKIVPRSKHLFPVNPNTLEQMRQDLGLRQTGEEIDAGDEQQQRIIVLKEHKYYKKLIIELYTAGFTKSGGLKNPIEPVAIDELLWRAEATEHLKFFTGVARFQQYSERERTKADLDALKAIVRNPNDLRFFVHDKRRGENVSAKSLQAVKVTLFRGVPA